MARWAASEDIARETGMCRDHQCFGDSFNMVGAGTFEELLLCLFGLYLWEVLQTSDFEWSLLSRARKFSWPFVSGDVLGAVLRTLKYLSFYADIACCSP